MAVQVWIGEKPEHPNERRAIVALANGLERLEGLYLILANFHVGGRSIDLVIMKQDAVFIIELKHCDGKVFGSVNGPWFVESANNERKRLNPGRRNPYNQVISYFHSLTNFLNEHRSSFLSTQKATAVDFRTCRRVVVIAPTIQEGSTIELDWKVELKGLDELPAFLVTERSSEIELSEEEMLAIPKLLHCTRWNEVDNLIAGVLPNWQTTSAETTPAETTSPPTTPDAPPAPTTAHSTDATWGQRLITLMQTTKGRLTLGASAITLLLLIFWVVRPPQNIPLPSGPPILVNPTDNGLAGVFANPQDANEMNCIWSNFQPIARRWDKRSQAWVSVGMNTTTNGPTPDIVVTLEQVAYCSGRIKLTLSVRNNSTRVVEFPLLSKNISIRDQLGNEYTITDSESRPDTVLRIEPAQQEHGTVVALRPLSQNASSLLVLLKEKPFGEAGFFVSLVDS